MNAERQWRRGVVDPDVANEGFGVVNAVNAERQWRRQFALRPSLLDPLRDVVNAVNAERQWRLVEQLDCDDAGLVRVVNAVNAERQWRPIHALSAFSASSNCGERGERRKAMETRCAAHGPERDAPAW